MADRAGIQVEAMHHGYWRHRHEYDMGLPAEEYWRRVLESRAPAADAALIESLIDLDVASWTAYREPVWQLAAAARAAGMRTAILSNGVPEIMRRVARDWPLDEIFDAVIVSCEVGCAKPDQAIFTLTLDRLGVAPADSLFVDDRRENIDAARRFGLDTLLFDELEGANALRRRLESPAQR